MIVKGGVSKEWQRTVLGEEEKREKIGGVRVTDVCARFLLICQSVPISQMIQKLTCETALCTLSHCSVDWIY